MGISRFAVAGGLLLALSVALAEPALPLSGPFPAPLSAPLSAPLPTATSPVADPAADCWKPHGQVQPSPQREGLSNDASFGERFRVLGEEHVGAEHPTPAQLRPCGSPPPPATAASGAADGER